ncbi:MAG: carboxypeptidase-like regulatory domain-containing protein, partial [Acidobacteriaceae bacterium]
MSSNQWLRILRWGGLASLVWAALCIHAQNTTSCAITGTVTDTTGAVLPGVEVQVTNQATGVSTVEKTNGDGYYTAEPLPPGDYSISTRKDGFRSVIVRDIHLDPGQRRGTDLKLVVGAVSATVSVEADAVAVQTESAELGGTISEKEVANLMLNGRNFQTLALIVPGVSAASGANALPNYGEGGYLGQTEIVVGGTSIEKTTYSLDGLFDMDPNALINVNVVPTIDSISEVRILKDNYSARYGMAGSGQILV